MRRPTTALSATSFHPSLSPSAKACALLLLFAAAHMLRAQQPAEPVDPAPLDGETYYFINQLSGLQMDLNNGSTAGGSAILQQPASYTNLSQRWAVSKAPDGNWKISNLQSGLCLDSVTTSGASSTIQNPCLINTPSQEWTFTYTTNGYNVVLNAATSAALDVTGASATPGAALDQTSLAATPTQSQQWLFRPAFFRGDDNALLEKQESLRAAANDPWWQDAGQTGDVLRILKNHGFNLIRIRPTSIPPYTTYTAGSSPSIPATCTGNGCYAETDPADLDLAKRAKQLGMSVELTLLFDGGSSVATPGAWSGLTTAQAQTAIYNYTKAEIEAYRAAGVMPDMVSIGNEVDTGFLASIAGSPSGAANSTAFKTFSAYETSAMQAVADAAADPALGAALPTPIRCIHITPAWDLTSFFTEVNADAIPYDAVCQSYYPIYHGPLTAAQAAAANPYSKPVEQAALTAAATSLGKPIFLIEVGEHYENGFDSNDPWYPATPAGQRQFVLDLQSVLKALPSNLGMGMEYWNGAGVNIPNSSGFTAGDGSPDATFVWNGLTLFDNADTAGSTSVTAPTYSAVLPALSAVGGSLDPTLHYKLVNAADGTLLETAAALTTSGAALDTGADTGVISAHQQWQITSNNDGYFQIANLNPATPANVLDAQSNSISGSSVVQVSAAMNTASQEWNIVSAGGGAFTLVNKQSGLVLTAAPGSTSADIIVQQTPSATNADWITPTGKAQTWRLVPVHISIPSAATQLAFASATLPSVGVGVGSSPGLITVSLEDSAGALIGSTPLPVSLTLTGPGSTSQTINATSSNGVASLDLSTFTLAMSGTYTLTASSPGLTSATAQLNVTAAAATTTVLASSATSATPGTGLTLTATVAAAAGSPQPTGSVTFLDGTATLGTAALTAGVATYTTSSLPAGTHSITASFAGGAGDAASVSSALQITIAPMPDFTVALSPTSASVAPGASATTSVSITPIGSFAAATSLSCSGLPANSTCSFSPSSVTPSGSSATSTLTISTNVSVPIASLATPRRPGLRSTGLFSAAVLLALLWPASSTRRRRQLWRTVASLSLVLVFAQILSGCSSSSSSPTPTPVTPAGQFNVTITAAAGSISHTAAFQLTVQ